jgi:hypothetical protein
MDDLRLILVERSPFYAKADITCDTNGQSVTDGFRRLVTDIAQLRRPEHAQT